MSERFTRVYSLPENLYAAGSPVVIAAGALLKDNQTGKILAQLKLRNISQKGIKAAKVCIFPCDTIGNPLGDSVSYQYLDLNVARDADFGQKSAITLPNATTRAFAATVEEIIFSDNTVRTASCAAWESLSAPTPLSSLGNPELVKQFCLEYGKNSKNLPLEQKELWYCSCGALNRGEESSCHCCGQSLFALQSIDMDALRANADKRIAAEKAQAEKEAAAAKAKAKKNGKIAAIVVPIAAVLIVGAVLLSNALKKDHAYDDAVALLDAGQYEEAIAAFEALEGYKDSDALIETAYAGIEAEKKALEEERKSKAYDEAITLLDSGNNENENKAYYTLLELGDYKDAKKLLECFKYVCLATDNIRYIYDSSGTLIEEDHGSYSDHFEYENGRMIWEGTSKSDWAATTYTYYPDGTLKSIVGGVSRDSNGVVTTQSIYYDESGYPKTIEYVRANKPNEHETWSLSYTFSDSGSITTFVCSIQDYGETEATTGSFDFGNYDGFISIEIAPVNSYLISPVRLTFTNSDRTYAEMHFLNYSSYFKSFSIRKDTEITTEYDSNGNIASKTTFYPVSDRKITTYYSYDNYENLIEELSPADENTDKKTYTTTYTYGYIYAPDAQ